MKYTKRPSKWLSIIFILFTIFFILITFKRLDNDIWYILAEGRYIFNHGIYHIDPLSMHEGLKVVVQNYLSALLFYLTYRSFGYIGIFIFLVLCNTLIAYLLYKICQLLDENNYLLSMFLALVTDFILSIHFIVTRPQIISFILILLVIYIFELYIHKENKKALLFLPIISLLQVNLHSSLWWMIFLFALAYIVGEIMQRLIFHKTEFELKPLLYALLISFIVGFINPYTYKSITFIFTSFSDKYMHKFIMELKTFNFKDIVCQQAAIIFFAIISCYLIATKSRIRLRYIFLTLGTAILGCISIKGLSHYFLVSLFPFAYVINDMTPVLKKERKIVYIVATVVLLIPISYLTYKLPEKIFMKNDAYKAMNYIEKNYKKNVRFYATFNDGGYVEFRGYKPYLDPRAEVFIKINNKKSDIFKEYYDLENNNLDELKFLEKYNFDVLLIPKTDNLYSKITKYDDYVLKYKDIKYSVYEKKI